ARDRRAGVLTQARRRFGPQRRVGELDAVKFLAGGAEPGALRRRERGLIRALKQFRRRGLKRVDAVAVGQILAEYFREGEGERPRASGGETVPLQGVQTREGGFHGRRTARRGRGTQGPARCAPRACGADTPDRRGERGQRERDPPGKGAR